MFALLIRQRCETMHLPLVLFFHFILFSFTGICQVTDRVGNDQPNPVWFPRTATCCEYLEEPTELMTCVKNLNLSDRNDTVVAVVTYVSKSIYEYASFAVAVQAVYSEHNNYTFQIQTSENGNNFEPIDQRWNKVKILSNALDASNGWARHVDYIVWLDADLIIMDLGMRFEVIGRAYPDADIIMSNDLGGSLDFANSGVILVKNTVWSQHFLHMWWECDRAHMSDQMAFQLLQSSLSHFDKQKIKLLPIDAINTHFPPHIYQMDYNQVLHLAGETDAYRQVIFQRGWSTICTHTSPIPEDHITPLEPHQPLPPLPRQLGLTREVLQQYHTEKSALRVHVLRQLQQQFHSIDRQAPPTSQWNVISTLRGKITNALKDAETEIIQNGFHQEFYDLTMDLLMECYTTFRSLALQSRQQVQTTSVEVGEMIRMAISTAYDVMDFHGAFHRFLPYPPQDRHQQVVQLLQAVNSDLLPVFKNVLPSSLYPKARYYDLKFYQFLSAAKEMAGAPPDEYLAARVQAIEVWRELHRTYQYYGTDYISIDPLKEGSRLLADTAVRYAPPPCTHQSTHIPIHPPNYPPMHS